MNGIEAITDRWDLPFIDHEKAVDAIHEKLKEEFLNLETIRISGRTKLGEFGIEWKGAVPDLIVRHNDGKMIMVEVGSTEAEKISFYLSRPSVSEVRWYDRHLNLIGQWTLNGQDPISKIGFDESLNHLIKTKDHRIADLADQVTEQRQKTGESLRNAEKWKLKSKTLKAKLDQSSPRGEAKREKEYFNYRGKKTLFRKKLFDEHIERLNKEMLEVLFVLFNQEAENVYFFCPGCFNKVSFWNASIVPNSNGATSILVCPECRRVPSIQGLEIKLQEFNQFRAEAVIEAKAE
jgi:hypothetical protein